MNICSCAHFKRNQNPIFSNRDHAFPLTVNDCNYFVSSHRHSAHCSWSLCNVKLRLCSPNSFAFYLNSNSFPIMLAHLSLAVLYFENKKPTKGTRRPNTSMFSCMQTRDMKLQPQKHHNAFNRQYQITTNLRTNEWILRIFSKHNTDINIILYTACSKWINGI